MVTLLRGKAFVIISLEFYTKLTLHWFIYAVSFIKLFWGQTSLNYFWARHLDKPPKISQNVQQIV